MNRRFAIIASVLVLMMGAIGAWLVYQSKEPEGVDGTSIQMHNIEMALKHHIGTYGVYPSTEEGLKELVKKKIMKEVPEDMWGNEFRYVRHHERSYTLKSLGTDDITGGSEEDEDVVVEKNRSRPDFKGKVDPIGDEEYAVYSAVLAQAKYLQHSDNFSLVGDKLHQPFEMYIIRRKTIEFRYMERDKYQSEEHRRRFELDESLEKKLSLMESGVYLRENKIVSEKEIYLISEEEHSWDEIEWSEFYENYPASHGIITFSRVAINESGTRAVVHFGNMRRQRYGAGYNILLIKKDGKWNVVKEVCTWVS